MARTEGVDLLERLNDGRMEVAPSAFVLETRDAVTLALEELLDVGARIRPLYLGNKRVGWARGVHLHPRDHLVAAYTSAVTGDTQPLNRHIRPRPTSTTRPFVIVFPPPTPPPPPPAQKQELTRAHDAQLAEICEDSHRSLDVGDALRIQCPLDFGMDRT